jgi:PDZ domain-containing secreted protein
MIATIKKGASKEEIKAVNKNLLKNSSSSKKFNAYKFCGAVSFSEYGVEIQKRLRDEWQ